MFDIRTLPPLDRSALLRIIVHERQGCALESLAVDAPGARFSIYAFDPVNSLVAHDEDPFELLARAWRPLLNAPEMLAPAGGHGESPTRPPFIGGWIGYLSYESGRFVEPRAIPRLRAHAMPLAQWRLYDTAIIHDAGSGQWYAVASDLGANAGLPDRRSIGDRLDAAEELARRANHNEAETTFLRNGEPRWQIGAGAWLDTPEAYREKVARALEYIRAGDIFQVNIARRYRARFSGDPLELYLRLGCANPSAYAAFIPFERGAVLSSSPELFLSLASGEVITRPIKGTRPRGASAADDARLAVELATSEKDRAELNMIIDLERNDLGRVCEFGTIRVLSDGEIERLPTVFHRTATVRGRLRPDCDAINLLRATFPGGSITGAPKVRAMQIIDELEGEPRGPYCGAIGYLDVSGDMMLNLPIRTMTIAAGQLELSVGSGIVADSTPDDELDELTAKAAGLMRALDGDAALAAAARNERVKVTT